MNENTPASGDAEPTVPLTPPTPEWTPTPTPTPTPESISTPAAPAPAAPTSAPAPATATAAPAASSPSRHHGDRSRSLRSPGPRTGPIVWGALILVFCGYIAQQVFGLGGMDPTVWITATVIGLGVLLLGVGIAVLVRNRRLDRRRPSR
ncbi:hypothetical protein [Leucobacter japonicus]|uniref:hypothetical protein n=1 Tax=Leucobacter japonicus TaxID=1461259 RepID=UPI0006A77E29|nr:hypothetical protein [Leucobacter japonicus]